MAEKRTGGCLCGAVRYTTNGPLREIVACHCTQCRRQTGHFYAATSSARADLDISGGDAITWYQASETARRGFCRHCGSALFWKRIDGDQISILAGSLDQPSGLKLTSHIFCADKADYYEIGDGLPQYDKGRPGVRVAED